MATSPPQRLPDFIIIGAAKAATTWIVHQLQQNPAIFLPGPEPHFFSRCFESGLDSYARWFDDASPAQIVGEKSADYLAHPLAAQRIADCLPDVRLVVQLRNPVERAYSDYCMLYRRGTVTAPPEAYLKRGGEQARFLEDGLYHRHLQRFTALFPRERLSLLLHEDIKRAPEAVIADMCDYLGVATHIAPAEVGARVNAGEVPMLPLALRRGLAPIKPLVAPLRRQPWFQAVHAKLARRPQYPPLSPDLRRRLRDFYAADIEQLGALVGRDVSHWLCVEDAR
jgi:hypothetical protein